MTEMWFAETSDPFSRSAYIYVIFILPYIHYSCFHILYFLINTYVEAVDFQSTGFKGACLGGARFFGKIPERSEDDFSRKPL